MKTRTNKKDELVLTISKEEFANLKKATDLISQKVDLSFLSKDQKLAFYQLAEILSL